MADHFHNHGVKSSGVKSSIERDALFLALTQSREKEEELKQILASRNLNCAVTEIGGTVATLQPTGKLTHSVISAALNTGVIKKDPKEIHAVIHATLEASNSVFIHTNSNSSFALKVGMVTDGDWIAVAMFGRSSLHALSEHCRVGLGVMHL